MPRYRTAGLEKSVRARVRSAARRVGAGRRVTGGGQILVPACSTAHHRTDRGQRRS